MKTYEFKFDMGDTAYKINDQERAIYQTCDLCKGKGRVQVGEYMVMCPKCNGNGRECTGSEHVYSVRKLTIGQQRVTIGNEYRGGEIEEMYMCKETGIGTGSCYHAKDLYDTKEKAEEEAKRRYDAQFTKSNKA